jgi:NAD(P)-dependent dehydrogenase (short-subunit alcohol dehydrogenase family)
VSLRGFVFNSSDSSVPFQRFSGETHAGHRRSHGSHVIPSDSSASRALPGRSVVVIGGTTGIGLSIALALQEAGARVVSVGLDAASVAGAATRLGADAVVFEGDAREPAAVERAIAACVDRFGGLDGLVHVAGGSGRRLGDGALHEITDEGWRGTLDLNLTSVFLSNRAALRRLLAQGQGGAVLNIGSVLAWSPAPQHFSTHAYAAAKAGIIGLTRACAARYAANDIRFNVVAPGLIDTPMAARALQDAEIRTFVRARQPLDGGRAGHPSEVSAAAVFLMSDAARFITGQVLAVDGGWTVAG